MLDLDYDDAQRAIGAALEQFCAAGGAAARREEGFSEVRWRALAAQGVFAVAAPAGEGGALEVAAAMEALGAAAFPGPLAATFFALAVLPAPERDAVAEGERVVSLGAPPLWPFGPVAQLFLELDGERVFRAHPRGALHAHETLGGEPWGRGEHERGAELAAGPGAFALLDAAHAAYQAAAGRRLVDEAAAHARTRRQFGRAIGEFQAVAHPLADCLVALEGATALARAAAFRIDRELPAARATAAAARLAADRAALRAAGVAHQVFGALGATLAGPVFRVSRRIRQLASAPPGPEPARARVLAAFDLARGEPGHGER